MSITDVRPGTAASQLPTGLLDNIIKLINPRCVILFGSRVSGNAREDSDWDVLIVVDDDTRQEQVNWQVMSEVRRDIRGAVELIPYRDGKFRERQSIKGSLPWIASNEGVVVYERADAT